MHKARQQTEKGNSMTNKTSDANRSTREQQSRLTAMGMNAFRPIMHLQVSMLRMWADSIERLAGNYEKGVEETVTAMKEQPDKERAA
jgi:hypothetical protein